MKGLKGQVSIFIILGIIILIMVGINLYLTYGGDDLDVSDFSPDALTPIERYITQCLETSTKDALVLLGQQGGYIYMDSDVAMAYYTNPRNYLQPLSGGLKVPLWDIRGNVVMPTIESMSSDIKRFIEDDVSDCIRGVSEQPSVSDAVFKNEPEATVEITQDDVTVFLEYKVQVTLDNRIIEYDKYATQVDLRLRKILETAEFLTYRHRTDLIVPDVAMNMIALDPDLPLGDIRFSCEPLFWSERQVTQTLQNHMAYMVPQIRIDGTDYQPFNEPLSVYERFDSQWDSERVAREGLPDNLPIDIYEYTQQFWRIPDYEFDGLQVGLVYDDSYGMDLQVNPSDGDKIESIPGRSGPSYLRYLCMNIYHFTYDVVFPFEVRIYDAESIDGQGFTFSYALPAKIDHNYPTQFEPQFISPDALETSSDFCENTRDETSLIVAKNAESDTYITNVDITYDCIKYYCDMGTITTDSGSGVPDLRINLPSGCFNGFFIAEKDGFLRQKVQIENPDVVQLNLLPLKDFNFLFANQNTDTRIDDTIYDGILFVKAKDYDFEQYARYPSVEDLPTRIQLLDVPADYEIEIMMFANNNFVGGYFGDLVVTAADLSKSKIYFYPNIKPDLVRNSNENAIVSLYTELDENEPPYREQLYPQFK